MVGSGVNSRQDPAFITQEHNEFQPQRDESIQSNVRCTMRLPSEHDLVVRYRRYTD